MRWALGLLVAAMITPVVGVSPATADPWTRHGSITATAKPAQVDEGDRVVIRGEAVGYAVGSPVSLRLEVKGEWVTTQETLLEDGGRYRFAATPAHGHRILRVVVRDTTRGWYAGAETAVDVRWTPTLSATVRWIRNDAGHRVLHLEGRTSYNGHTGDAVAFETGDRRGWWTWQLMHVRRGHFSGDLDVWPGTHSRVWLRGDGQSRQEAAARVVVPEVRPTMLALNDPNGSGDPVADEYADFLIDLPAHRLVTLSGLPADGIAAITDPRGRSVEVREVYSTVSFDSTVSGRYTIDRNADWGVVHASTPRVVQGEIGTPLDPVREVPGQYVDVVFHGTAGEFVSRELGDDDWPSIIGPEGSILTPAASLPGLPPIFRLPVTGSYTFRDWGTSPTAPHFDLQTVAQQTAEIDGPTLHVDLGQPSVVVVPATAGHPFTIASPGCRQRDLRLVLFDPLGQTARLEADAVPALTGDYLLYVTPGQEPVSDALAVVTPTTFELPIDGGPVAQSTDDLGCAVYRGSMPGTEGQVVRVVESPGALHTAQVFTAGGYELWPIAGKRIYRLPATGPYSVRFSVLPWDQPAPWSGEFSVVTEPVTDLTADGSAIPLTIDAPGGYLLGHVDLPAGGLHAVFDTGTLNGGYVAFRSSTGNWIDHEAPGGGLNVGTFEPGGAYVYVRSSDPTATGTAILTLTPRT